MERRILREIYTKYGEEVIFNPKKLRAYLLDMHVPKRTVNLLTDISRIDYFRQFADEIKTDESVRQKLIYSTENEYAFEKSAVKFGVDCWVYAFIENDDYENSAEENVFDDEIWPEEKAEIVAAALRELLK